MPAPQDTILDGAAWIWIGVGVSIVGLWSFSFQLRNLWHIWTTDGLRSIGILIPPTSLLLSLRAWRGHRWEGGSWCGLALAIACAVVAILPFSGLWVLFGYGIRPGAVNFLPTGLWLWGYVSSVVILFGGVGAWRKAAFPLALLLFVNPVPAFFTNLVDLPLQHLGARAARIFAGWVAVPVSGKGGDLWLYFAPGYGMFIASACNVEKRGYYGIPGGHSWLSLWIVEALAPRLCNGRRVVGLRLKLGEALLSGAS